MAARLRFAIVLFALFTFASAACYWPTGNLTYDRDLYEHQPCSNDTTSPVHTICCALNRTNFAGGDILNGRTNDECLPNGICRNRVLNHGTMQISYWRETCTSQDWKTGKCLDVCADDWTAGNLTTGAIMTPCDDTAGSLKWCCGVDKSCCNDPQKVKIIPFEFGGAVPNTSQGVQPSSTAASSTVSSSASSAASSTTATSPASATTGPQEVKSSSGLSTGAKAGIGVGAAIGGLALLAAGFFLARAFGGKKESPPAVYEAPAGNKEQYPYELPHQTQRSELEYSPVPQLSPGMVSPMKYAQTGPRHEMA